MARFRMALWFPDRPSMVRVSQFQLGCRLCAAQKAMEHASQMEKTHAYKPGTCKWKLEMLKGAIDRWEIQVTSDSHLNWIIRRHGH